LRPQGCDLIILIYVNDLLVLQDLLSLVKLCIDRFFEANLADQVINMHLLVLSKALGQVEDLLTGQLVDVPLLHVIKLSELKLVVGQRLILSNRRIQVEESGF